MNSEILCLLPSKREYTYKLIEPYSFKNKISLICVLFDLNHLLLNNFNDYIIFLIINCLHSKNIEIYFTPGSISYYINNLTLTNKKIISIIFEVEYLSHFSLLTFKCILMIFFFLLNILSFKYFSSNHSNIFLIISTNISELNLLFVCAIYLFSFLIFAKSNVLTPQFEIKTYFF